MPKCPHCGELYRRGQDRCYACGQAVRSRATGGRKGRANPLVFAVAGAVVVIAVVGFFLLAPKQNKETERAVEKAKFERLADSSRKANLSARGTGRASRSQDRLAGGIDDLEYRLDRLKKQAVGDNPSNEQNRLMNQIRAEIGRMRSQFAGMAYRSEDEQDRVADSIRAGQRGVRNLLSKLSRASKGR